SANSFYDMAYPGTDPQFAAAVNSRRQVEERRKAREQALTLLKTEFRVEKENTKKLADKADSSFE
ncbi:MAG: hypothetical protein ACRCZF_13035, partial [Gemmataceae bacterium]